MGEHLCPAGKFKLDKNINNNFFKNSNYTV